MSLSFEEYSRIKPLVITEPVELGYGDENLCLKLSSNSVLKLNLDFLRSKLELVLKKHNNILINTEEYNLDLYYFNLFVSKVTADKILLNYVGEEHVLARKIRKVRITISDFFINRSFSIEKASKFSPLILEDLTLEIFALEQPFAPELYNIEKYKTIDFKTFLITQDDFKKSSSLKEGILKIEHSIDSNFIPYIKDLYNNTFYRDSLYSIIKGIAAYSKDTHAMLDIFGPNNIVLFLNDTTNKPDFHFIDFLLPGSKDYWLKDIEQDIDLKLFRHYYTYFYSLSSLITALHLPLEFRLKDLIYFSNDFNLSNL